MVLVLVTLFSLESYWSTRHEPLAMKVQVTLQASTSKSCGDVQLGDRLNLVVSANETVAAVKERVATAQGVRDHQMTDAVEFLAAPEPRCSLA